MRLLEPGLVRTGFPLWLVNDSNWRRLDSETPSAPKSSLGVEADMALTPVPVMGTVKAVSLSALTGLVTVRVAVRGDAS